MEIKKDNFIFYDLETNGLDHYTTGIMQITLLDIDGNIFLNQYVYPFDKRIDGTNIHGIDEKKLIDNNAINTDELIFKLLNIINNKYNNENVFLIAYNNFGYDQIILENNFKLYNMNIPDNWYFIDMYPIIKDLYPNMANNYKLSTIYENLCGINKDIEFHTSLSDTICLYKIYKLVENNHYCFMQYLRCSLHNKNILKSKLYTFYGFNKKIPFEKYNINCIGDLYQVYKNTNFNKEIFELFLKNKLNIYSNSIVHNIVSQLNLIKHFM
jgi:DNA polymerase III epsilon subunit-like protein